MTITYEIKTARGHDSAQIHNDRSVQALLADGWEPLSLNVWPNAAGTDTWCLLLRRPTAAEQPSSTMAHNTPQLDRKHRVSAAPQPSSAAAAAPTMAYSLPRDDRKQHRRNGGR